MNLESQNQPTTHIEDENDVELTAILSSLPLEKCEYKSDPVTGDTGWYAPEGFAFRISGKFVVEYDHSKGETRIFLPTASVDLLETDPEGWGYEEFQIEHPTEFIGKWFCIELSANGKTVIVRKNIDPYYLDDDSLLEFNGFLLPLDGVAETSSVEWTREYASGIPGNFEITMVPYEENKGLIILEPRQKEAEILLPLGVRTAKE